MIDIDRPCELASRKRAINNKLDTLTDMTQTPQSRLAAIEWIEDEMRELFATIEHLKEQRR